MRRLVLKAILNLGRYAILPVVGFAGVLLMAWLMVLDRYTMAALATAPIVFCVATAALALALGILLLPSRRDRNFRADETAAPACGRFGRSSIAHLPDRGEPSRSMTISTPRSWRKAGMPGCSGNTSR